MSQARRTRHFARSAKRVPRSPRLAHKVPVMQATKREKDECKKLNFLPSLKWTEISLA